MIRTHDPGAAPAGPSTRRSRRAAPQGRGGFSLTEVMAVLVIVGIGLAMATPRINLTAHRTESAVQGLASTLMAAQRAAVARQHDVVVAFETDQQRIRIHFDIDNDGIMDGGETIRREPLGNTVVFGRGPGAAQLAQLGAGSVSFAGRQNGVPAVTFGRGGDASEEGGAYLTTATGTNPTAYTSRAVVVDRATGRAAVFRYTQSGWQRRF
jgi:prepilin-type N-terminal cleavage/methylation domain-containing protein